MSQQHRSGQHRHNIAPVMRRVRNNKFPPFKKNWANDNEFKFRCLFDAWLPMASDANVTIAEAYCNNPHWTTPREADDIPRFTQDAQVFMSDVTGRTNARVVQAMCDMARECEISDFRPDANGRLVAETGNNLQFVGQAARQRFDFLLGAESPTVDNYKKLKELLDTVYQIAHGAFNGPSAMIWKNDLLKDIMKQMRDVANKPKASDFNAVDQNPFSHIWSASYETFRRAFLRHFHGLFKMNKNKSNSDSDGDNEMVLEIPRPDASPREESYYYVTFSRRNSNSSLLFSRVSTHLKVMDNRKNNGETSALFDLSLAIEALPSQFNQEKGSLRTILEQMKERSISSDGLLERREQRNHPYCDSRHATFFAANARSHPYCDSRHATFFAANASNGNPNEGQYHHPASHGYHSAQSSTIADSHLNASWTMGSYSHFHPSYARYGYGSAQSSITDPHPHGQMSTITGYSHLPHQSHVSAEESSPTNSLNDPIASAHARYTSYSFNSSQSPYIDPKERDDDGSDTNGNVDPPLPEVVTANNNDDDESSGDEADAANVGVNPPSSEVVTANNDDDSFIDDSSGTPSFPEVVAANNNDDDESSGDEAGAAKVGVNPPSSEVVTANNDDDSSGDEAADHQDVLETYTSDVDGPDSSNSSRSPNIDPKESDDHGSDTNVNVNPQLSEVETANNNDDESPGVEAENHQDVLGNDTNDVDGPDNANIANDQHDPDDETYSLSEIFKLNDSNTCSNTGCKKRAIFKWIGDSTHESYDACQECAEEWFGEKKLWPSVDEVMANPDFFTADSKTAYSYKSQDGTSKRICKECFDSYNLSQSSTGRRKRGDDTSSIFVPDFHEENSSSGYFARQYLMDNGPRCSMCHHYFQPTDMVLANDKKRKYIQVDE